MDSNLQVTHLRAEQLRSIKILSSSLILVLFLSVCKERIEGSNRMWNRFTFCVPFLLRGWRNKLLEKWHKSCMTGNFVNFLGFSPSHVKRDWLNVCIALPRLYTCCRLVWLKSFSISYFSLCRTGVQSLYFLWIESASRGGLTFSLLSIESKIRLPSPFYRLSFIASRYSLNIALKSRIADWLTFSFLFIQMPYKCHTNVSLSFASILFPSRAALFVW